MIIIFDTDCLFCSRWIGFVLQHERDETTQFVSAWSDEGLSMAQKYGFSRQDLDETFLVIKNGEALTKSDAGIALLGQLRQPWSWGCSLRFLPRFFRDKVYDVIACNRYRWFGRRDQCFVPSPDKMHRFVAGPPKGTHP